MHCIILAAGNFPEAQEPLEALMNASFVCCCDSAAKNLLAWGREPDAIVGDGDSLDAETKEKYRDRWHHVTEQDYNDLTKATKFCIGQGFTDITYLGATGKREDHTIGNIALMAYYFNTLHITPRMITDHGTFTVHKGKTEFRSFAGQQVSIFQPFKGNAPLSSEGLKWNSHSYDELWQGTLNEALGDSFTLNSDETYIVFRTHRKKQKSDF